ncbi:hypothetical protein DXG01_005094 [Tephrocybe rancida]|nr:hypothetical protein DXG01_005094 [Tephrocybe rancida]
MASLNRLPSVFRKNSASTNGTATGSTKEKISGSGAQAIRDFREQASVVDFIRNKEAIDDRKFFLEHGLTFISRLEPGKFQTAVQNKVVEILYNDLGHPAATSISEKYAWRTADGSYNNIDLPDMGKFVKHPAGLSSMMFSFAALVIHTVFRTSHHDVNINETSSYVDLSPLYGHNQEAQDRVRLRDGYGHLKPDVFAEDRLLLLPPAVCALLVLFSRNHNYIVNKLFEIKERRNYVDPTTLKTDNPADKKTLLEQEEELFQIAKLINCGWFASVVFSDYFSCILGLVRDGSSWSLDPFSEIRLDDHSVFERGKGNVCSVEFNCLYRWHATTSAEDEKWVNQTFQEIFDGKDPEFVTIGDFKDAAHKIAARQPDITDWTFGGLKRQADYKFSDDDLANILHNATERPAGAFRARGTPEYESFLEWNSDEKVADAAEKLYGDINNLELYVGLQAEEAKPVMEGAGLCPGYTISRAILSDAIALTRGDRFFTHDYTPYNLTAWGFADCQRDADAFGFGSTLGRLLLRNLPNNYTENSVYTFFPLMTPDAMEVHLKKLKVVDQYDLLRPKNQSGIKVVNSYPQVGDILKDRSAFASPYAARAARVLKGKGFYTIDGPEAQEKVYKALADSPESIDKIGRFFFDTTRKLVDSNSFQLIGKKTRGLDVVRDVLKYVPVYWAANEVAGFSLKTKENPEGHYTPQELYQILGDIYSFIFLDIEASKVMVLGAKISTDIKILLAHIKEHLGLGLIHRNSIISIFSKNKKTEYNELVKRLGELGGSTDELANTILALLVGSTVELSLALTNAVNLYLGSEHDATIRGVAKSNDAKASLDGFVYEALSTATKDHSVGSLTVKEGDRVFLDVGAVNLDEAVFSSANAVNTGRAGKNVLPGDGAFSHLGEKLTIKILSEVLRAVFSYDNVRRAPGQSGVLARFKEHSRPELAYAYIDHTSFSSPWPTSLSILYDAEK